MKEINLEDLTFDWEDYVRSEVNALLDKLLPPSVGGKLQLKYRDLVLIETEAGPDYDNTKAVGVDITISLDFEKPIDKNFIVQS